MRRIRFRTANASYEAVVERGLLVRAGELIAPFCAGRRLFVVADEQVLAHHGERLQKALSGLDFTLLPAAFSEERKRLELVESLAERMHRAGADRTAVVAAFGGGIAGDVGGFLAACYMRGVDVVQIPTTLLAQVDSAVGGKTGVNLAAGKNLFGAFHQPRLTIVDPDLLDTLPEREYRAGLFEVVKYGVIRSRELFDLLDKERARVLAREPEALERIIAESIAIKADVVAEDEREGGVRRILNYGHTLGHALEAETGYSRLLHGEAVAWGMIAAGRLGEAIGLTPAADRVRMEETIAAYGPIPSLDGIAAGSVAARVAGDKKTIGGKVHFVLAESIGAVQVVTGIPERKIVEAAREAFDALAARERVQ